MPLSIDKATEQLNDRTAAKRCAAAKRLRFFADPVASPALLDALYAELANSRTWDTQYQMVMALGVIGHAPAVPLLEQRPRQRRQPWFENGDGWS